MRLPNPLEPEDFDSRLWQRMRAHLETRLAVLRQENDGSSDELTTAKRRGRIAEIKELLALDIRPQHNPGAPHGGTPMTL